MFRFVDLSNNNPAPNVSQLAGAGFAGGWLKVSEGATFVDETWAARSADFRAHGLHVGGYHFARPGSAIGAHAQGLRFAHLLGELGVDDLRPVLDLEDDGGLDPPSLAQWVRDFNLAVRDTAGAGPILYSYRDFLASRHWTAPLGYGLWLADYGPDNGLDNGYHVPPPWRKCVAHQYTSRGLAAGVAGHVDLTAAAALEPLLAHPDQAAL